MVCSEVRGEYVMVAIGEKGGRYGDDSEVA